MSVSRFITCDDAGFAEYQVGGTTFAPIGTVTRSDGQPLDKSTLITPTIRKLSEICAICNDAKVTYHPVSFCAFRSFFCVLPLILGKRNLQQRW